MGSETKPRAMVAAAERDKIDRKVLIWLNKFPESPVATITTETQLASNEPGMALSSTTNAYVSKRYILGGYQAEYQFKIIYRIKPGKSMDQGLKARELLNRMGDWCIQNKPDLGPGILVRQVTPVSIADMYAPYEDGDVDYQIPMKIVYEVI